MVSGLQGLRAHTIVGVIRVSGTGLRSAFPDAAHFSEGVKVLWLSFSDQITAVEMAVSR